MLSVRNILSVNYLLESSLLVMPSSCIQILNLRSWRSPLRLVGDVATCLGDSFQSVFGVEKSSTINDLKDMIKAEISFYRMEAIPESMYLNELTEKNSKTSTQKSYWRSAYEAVAGIKVNETKDEMYRCVDSY